MPQIKQQGRIIRSELPDIESVSQNQKRFKYQS